MQRLPTTLLEAAPVSDIARLKFSNDGKWLAMCSPFGGLSVWSTDNCALAWSDNDTRIDGIAFNPTLDAFAVHADNPHFMIEPTGLMGRKIILRALSAGDELLSIDVHDAPDDDCRFFGFDSTGKFLANVQSSRTRLIDLNQRTVLHEFEHEDDEEGMHCSFEEGNQLLVKTIAGYSQVEKTLRVTRIPNADRLLDASFEGPFVFSHDGNYVAVGHRSAPMRWEIWDTQDNRKCANLTTDYLSRHAGFLTTQGYFCEVFGGRLSAGATPPITIRDINSGATILRMDSPRRFAHLRCSPRHPIIALASNNRNADVDQTSFLHAETGETLGFAERHPVHLADNHQFSPCGRWFASASTDLSIPDQQTPVPSGTIVLTDLAPILNL